MTDLVKVLALVLHPGVQPADNNLAARAVLTALEAAGYRVVPVEPTPEMLDAGWVKADAEWIGGARNLPREEIAQLWLAMLAAAPKITTGG